jgi:hypothetical protein
MNKTKERPTSQPITVNIDKLSAMLSCGHATARKIGEQAGAKIVIGRRVLYSVEKVKNYLSEFSSFMVFSAICHEKHSFL